MAFESRYVDPDQLPSLASIAMTMRWFAAKRAGLIGGFSDAESFLEFDQESGCLSQLVPASLSQEIEIMLRTLASSGSIWPFLPHVSEVFLTDLESFHFRGPERQRKKASGVFFTPDDVADYLASFVWDKEDGLIVDPACGSGSLLRAVLRKRVRAGQDPLKALGSLCGIDISPVALQTCAYVLGLEAAAHGARFGDALSVIRRNLVQADATRLSTLGETLAFHADPQIAAVIANPPYGRQACGASRQPALFEGRPRGQEDAYLRFLTSALESLNGNGRIAFVIPLSISCSGTPSVSRVRSRLLAAPGWTRFVHFDRTPDSLFGDDVKVRNAIVLHEQSQKEFTRIESTSLRRWAVQDRSELWRDLSSVEVTGLTSKHGVPKIGTPWELELLTAAGNSCARLGSFIRQTPSMDSMNTVGICRHAYNWIPGYLQGEVGANRRVVTAIEPLNRGSVFAILQSRLAFWWWRVWGDGFHITDEIIAAIPLGTTSEDHETISQLAMLGEVLWLSIADTPNQKTNGGKESVTYCPYRSPVLLDRIDLALVSALGLGASYAGHLKSYVSSVVTAGRRNHDLRYRAHEVARLVQDERS